MFLKLAGSIETQLREAYARLHEADLENQSSIARKLGVDRSAVNRRLTGQTNMTLESLADLLWALRQDIAVDIFDPASRRDGSNFRKAGHEREHGVPSISQPSVSAM